MKLSELAESTGCSVATIKYYLRENLLPPARLLRATEAEYDESHFSRLRLIRVLREVGNLPIEDIRQIVAALDDPTLTLNEKLARAYYALPPTPRGDDMTDETRNEVLAFVAEQGWSISPDAPSIVLFAEALTAARELWGPVGPEIFQRYAVALDALAKRDVDVLLATDDSDIVRQIVVGTVVWDRAITALRRMAADHYSTQRWKSAGRG